MATESIIINILRVKYLKGSKGDVVLSNLKVEFGDKLLGESPKVECSSEGPAEFNFQTKINCNVDDPVFLDEISSKPIIVTITEVLPKEKKQKDEKSIPLGQVSFDLLSLVGSETQFRGTLKIHAFPGSPLEGISADAAQPEIDFFVKTEQPLLGEALDLETNLISITVESLFSPPDSFSPSGPQGVYVSACPLSYSKEREVPIVFIGGNAKNIPEKEAPLKQKKWYLTGSAQGNAQYIPDSLLPSDPIEDEDGDYKGPEDKEFRRFSEQEKPRVTWNATRRCFLTADGLNLIQDSIAKSRIFPVEVLRLSQGSGGKGKKAEEDGSIGFHGVAYINAAPLLYPGVTRIRGAYRVQPYLEHEYQEKTKRRCGVGEDAGKMAVSYMQRGSVTPTGKKAAEKVDKKPAAVEKAVDKKPQASKVQLSEGEEAPVLNAEGMQYLEHKSYVMVEISLRKPLVPKRTPEDMAKRVSEYIPPRPLFPKRTNCADKAISDYHQQIAEISSRVLDEFRGLFGDAIKSGQMPTHPDDVETMRQELMYSLNASGKYYAFKEQLKYAVIKIVREKYLKTTGFTDQSEMQTFLRDLFVYLVDQLQVGLKRVISLDEKVPIPAPVSESSSLKHFAREAEINENYLLAQRFYQERIARDSGDAEHWYDYGTFSLLTQDINKAEECFRETVAINQQHIKGLMMLGLVAAMQEKYEEAETYLEAATAHAPNCIITWTTLGIYFDSVGNDIGSEMAFGEATKMNINETIAQLKADKEAVASQQSETVTQSQLHQITEENTEDLKMPSTTSVQGVAQPVETGLVSSDNKLAKTSQASKMSRRTSSVKGGSKISVTGTPLPADASPQPDDPEPVASVVTPAKSIFLRTAEFLLQNNASSFAERALAHELAFQSSNSRSPAYCLAHARLMMQLRRFEEAEASLTELIEISHSDANAWALLGHLRYLVGYVQAAKDCYQRVLALTSDPDEPHPVIIRLASIHLQLGDFKEAKNTFLLACKRSPSAVSWLGVGIACYRLDELSEAEDALAEANLLNNKDPEVWAYLSLICLKTGRKLEAEQTYKYSMKVGLSDQSLIKELHKLQKEVGFGNTAL